MIYSVTYILYSVCSALHRNSVWCIYTHSPPNLMFYTLQICLHYLVHGKTIFEIMSDSYGTVRQNTYQSKWYIRLHTSCIRFAVLCTEIVFDVYTHPRDLRDKVLTPPPPPQRPVTQSFDVFFDLRLNKRLNKHSRRWWFETQSRPLWHHCNDIRTLHLHSSDKGVAYIGYEWLLLKQMVV